MGRIQAVMALMALGVCAQTLPAERGLAQGWRYCRRVVQGFTYWQLVPIIPGRPYWVDCDGTTYQFGYIQGCQPGGACGAGRYIHGYGAYGGGGYGSYGVVPLISLIVPTRG